MCMCPHMTLQCLELTKEAAVHHPSEFSITEALLNTMDIKELVSSPAGIEGLWHLPGVGPKKKGGKLSLNACEKKIHTSVIKQSTHQGVG